MESEICPKILINFREKLGAKLLATALSYSTIIVKITMSVILSQKFVSTGSMPSKKIRKKDKKRRKRKGEKLKKNKSL